MSKKGKTIAKPVGVSPQAHEQLSREAFDAKPRLTIRELINIKLNLSKNL